MVERFQTSFQKSLGISMESLLTLHLIRMGTEIQWPVGSPIDGTTIRYSSIVDELREGVFYMTA